MPGPDLPKGLPPSNRFPAELTKRDDEKTKQWQKLINEVNNRSKLIVGKTQSKESSIESKDVPKPPTTVQSQQVKSRFAKTQAFLKNMVSRIDLKALAAQFGHLKSWVRPNKSTHVAKPKAMLPPGLDQKLKIVKEMIAALEKAGALKKEGVFRIPGSVRKVNENIECYNSGKSVSYVENGDVYDVGSTLKAFIKEMQIFENPAEARALFLQCGKQKEPAQRLETIQKAVGLLPSEEKNALKELLGFCDKMVENQDTTKMTSANLSTCLSMNMVKEKENPFESLGESGPLGVAFKFMLENSDQIFEG